MICAHFKLQCKFAWLRVPVVSPDGVQRHSGNDLNSLIENHVCSHLKTFQVTNINVNGTKQIIFTFLKIITFINMAGRTDQNSTTLEFSPHIRLDFVGYKL